MSRPQWLPGFGSPITKRDAERTPSEEDKMWEEAGIEDNDE